MTKPYNMDRLALSAQVITAWEQFPNVPEGTPEDNLRMIGQEIDILSGLREMHPDDAETIDGLIVRYEALRDRIKQRAN